MSEPIQTSLPDFWQTTIGKAFLPALLIHKTPYATSEGQEYAWITSGLVVEAEGLWFWVTARHSLDHLEERVLNSPNVAVQFRPMGRRKRASGEVLTEEVFFAYDPARRLDFAKVSEEALNDPTEGEDEDGVAAYTYVSGLDINALHLSALEVANLKETGIVPLTEAWSWRNEDHQGLDEREARFGIAGVPNTDVKLNKSGKPEQWAYTVLPMRLESDEGSVTLFSPLWTKEDHQGGVKGMSGGPAYILFRGGLYWCGVQSGQKMSGERVTELQVCPSRFVMALLMALAKESRRIEREGGEPWGRAA